MGPENGINSDLDAEARRLLTEDLDLAAAIKARETFDEQESFLDTEQNAVIFEFGETVSQTERILHPEESFLFQTVESNFKKILDNFPEESAATRQVVALYERWQILLQDTDSVVQAAKQSDIFLKQLHEEYTKHDDPDLTQDVYLHKVKETIQNLQLDFIDRLHRLESFASEIEETAQKISGWAHREDNIFTHDMDGRENRLCDELDMDAGNLGLAASQLPEQARLLYSQWENMLYNISTRIRTQVEI